MKAKPSQSDCHIADRTKWNPKNYFGNYLISLKIVSNSKSYG